MFMFDDLAYAVGFFLGDGSLYSGPFISSRNGKTYFHNDVIFVKSDIEPIERVQAQIAEVFGRSYKVQTRILPSGQKHWTLTAHHRQIFEFFAVNTAMRQEIPAHYFGASREVKLELARGLMDSDGHCAEFIDRHDPKYEIKRWQLGYSGTKLAIVQGLAAILQSLKIRVGVISPAKKAGYQDCYIIHPNLRDFHQSGLFFYATRKQARVDRYLEHVLGSETLHAAPATPGEDKVQPQMKV